MGKKRYQSAGGVVMHNGQVLVLDRPSRGEVRLPKGHIEDGENARQAALREVAEESGYADLEVAADLGSQVVEFDYDGNHVVRTEYYFLMRLRSDHQVERDAKDAAQFFPVWLAPQEALARLTYAAEQETLRRALAADANANADAAD